MAYEQSWIESLSPNQRQSLRDTLTDEEAAALAYDWQRWARPKQLPPEGDWDGWLLLAGRGFGKTRVGSEFVRQEVEAKRAGRIALIAETSADGRDVLVEGESGILAISPPWFRPSYEPSKRRLTWPNGAIATLYDAREPDQLRGPQHDLALVDELAKYRYAQEVFDGLQFGLRLGIHPRWVATTTPRPIGLIRRLVNDQRVFVTRGSTMENLVNLAPTFRRAVIDRYAGTRLGRQELEAEILDDVPGALWSRRGLDEYRVNLVPALKRVVVGVDPAITSGDSSDETGIVCVGLDGLNAGYVLDDWSVKGSPDQWARRAVALFRKWEGDRIVAEANQGGEMVAHVIRSVAPDVPVSLVRATRGKYVRAEPVSALYEQGRIHHVGTHPSLEDQMVAFTPELAADRKPGESPDRVDALVWACTELFPKLTAREFVGGAERDEDMAYARNPTTGY
jgi:phage terminase large subunit-like protein